VFVGACRLPLLVLTTLHFSGLAKFLFRKVEI
jgi:hypothetical protein